MGDTTAVEIMADCLPEFPELVRTHQRMVFSLACHFLHDRASAEEVAQDVFLRLHRNLACLRSEAHVCSWLYKVTSNRCIDYARRRRRNLALDDIPEPAAESVAGDPLMVRRMRRAIASLPPKARIVVILRYQEDLGLEEISQVLGWRLNTVKSQLQRSLAMLRRKLGSVFGEAVS
jgi:RNA polymerase sigma-70 factor, ECF subfamily